MMQRYPSTYRLSLIAIVLLGFGLGFPLLTRYPFREDEAIYSFWALHFWQDPFFLTVWPDKPPVYLGILALAYKVFGASEASARWLNISFTTLSTALVIAMARHLWDQTAALLAGAMHALNPFVLSFAPTAYTDPLLVLFGNVALYAALKQHSYWSGVWLGLAIMTKQQGLFYLPLVLGLLLLSPGTPRKYIRHCDPRNLTSFLKQNRTRLGPSGFPGFFCGRQNVYTLLCYPLLGLTTVLAPIIYWDSLRWAIAPSPWELSIRNYGGLTLLSSTHWLAQGKEWAALAWYLLASRHLWFFALLALLSLAISKGVGRFSQRTAQIRHPMARNSNHANHVTILLFLWLLCFISIHVVSNIQIWDRYLLPLVAVGVLFCTGLLSGALKMIPSIYRWSLSLLWVLMLCPPGIIGGSGRITHRSRPWRLPGTTGSASLAGPGGAGK